MKKQNFFISLTKQHNGTCTSRNGYEPFTCTCKRPYTGEHCESLTGIFILFFFVVLLSNYITRFFNLNRLNRSGRGTSRSYSSQTLSLSLIKKNNQVKLNAFNSIYLMNQTLNILNSRPQKKIALLSSETKLRILSNLINDAAKTRIKNQDTVIIFFLKTRVRIST